LHKENNEVLIWLLIMLMINSEAFFRVSKCILMQDFFVHLEVYMSYLGVIGLMYHEQNFFLTLAVCM